MKKSTQREERVHQILIELTEVAGKKGKAIKELKYEQAAQLRDREKKLESELEKLTGKPLKSNQSTSIQKELNPEEEVEFWNSIYQEAEKQKKKKREKSTGGVVMGVPVHLNPENNVSAIDWDVPERERVYEIKGSRNALRKFDGNYHRHCSKCPFPEGCIMCTLP